MIDRLRGVITDNTLGSVVIDVNGVGYRVSITPETAATLSRADASAVTILTYLAIRENAHDLYGFLRIEDRDFFKLLLDVPGIGPKSALAILSLAPSETLARAISSGDTSYLTKVSGIGAKSAKKIIAELQDKIVPTGTGEPHHHTESEVIDVLASLGYSAAEAREALKHVSDEYTDTESRVKGALKALGGHKHNG